jgi:hypothetical protein
VGVKYVRHCPRCWAGDHTRARIVDGVPEACSLCGGSRFVTVPGEPLPPSVVDVLVEPAVPYRTNRHLADFAEPNADTQPISLDEHRKKGAPVDPLAWAREVGERQAVAMERIAESLGLLVEWTLAADRGGQ